MNWILFCQTLQSNTKLCIRPKKASISNNDNGYKIDAIFFQFTFTQAGTIISNILFSIGYRYMAFQLRQSFIPQSVFDCSVVRIGFPDFSLTIPISSISLVPKFKSIEVNYYRKKTIPLTIHLRDLKPITVLVIAEIKWGTSPTELSSVVNESFLFTFLLTLRFYQFFYLFELVVLT